MRCYHHQNAPATVVCLGCLRALCDKCASGHEHLCERGYEPSLGAAAINQPCHQHAFEPARGICAGCGQPICVRCSGLVDGQLTCPDCRGRDAVTFGPPQPARRKWSWPRSLGVGGAAAIGLVIALVALLAAGVVVLPGSANAQAGSSASVTPTELVLRHYAELSAGSYETAWQQLSPSFQKQVDFATWANSNAGSRVEPSDLVIASQTPTSATVVGSATVTSSAGTSAVVQGQWTVVLIDGAWRLDSISFMSSVEARR